VSDVEVQTAIAADPQQVWALVSDVTRMGEWSPETTSCRWVGDSDGPSVGARFRGSNKHRWLRWTTTCTVTAAVPGERFTFDVDYTGVPISTWSYAFAADPAGCVVTESWTDRRPMWMRVGSIPVMWVADRAAHNEATMRATLAALKAAAEAGAGAGVVRG
jgi:hypothetical protein